MTNLETAIRTAYSAHLSATFGTDYNQGCELPAFSAYIVKGRLEVFAGKLTETKYGRLMKALEVFAYQNAVSIAA